jgi:hypothetical protein
MTTSEDAHCVTATFTVYNKPVNAFWALFQVRDEQYSAVRWWAVGAAGELGALVVSMHHVSVNAIGSARSGSGQVRTLRFTPLSQSPGSRAIPSRPSLARTYHPVFALQVPEVNVIAKAFVPCTSLVTFELANGLSFTTFVSTAPISGACPIKAASRPVPAYGVVPSAAALCLPVPVSLCICFLPACPSLNHLQLTPALCLPRAATKTINRFALVRKLSSDKTGIFNAPLWDGMARRWVQCSSTEVCLRLHLAAAVSCVQPRFDGFNVRHLPGKQPCASRVWL